MAEMSLLFSFSDQTESFTNGFEVGMIWKTMLDGDDEIAPPMPQHAANRTTLERMARAGGYVMMVEDLPDCPEWMLVEFKRLRFEPRVIDGGKADAPKNAY